MSPEGSRQLVAPVLSEVEGLEQGLLVDKRDRPRGQEVGVGPKKVTSGRGCGYSPSLAPFERDVVPRMIVLSGAKVDFAEKHPLANICHTLWWFLKGYFPQLKCSPGGLGDFEYLR